MEVADVLFEDGTDALSFRWPEVAQVAVYSPDGTPINYSLKTGAGERRATFEAPGVTLADSTRYRAIYPFTETRLISLDFSNQTTAESLRDYLWAQAVPEQGNALFRFQHVGAFLRLDLTLPAETPIDHVDLVPMYGEVPEAMTFDVATLSATVGASSPIMRVETPGLMAPSGKRVSVWVSMPPQSFADDHFAVQVHSGADVYSARMAGADFTPGVAYRRELALVLTSGNPGYGFGRAAETGLALTTFYVGSGEYSGIAYMGGTRYAVVHDKLAGGGIVLFDIAINDDGSVGAVYKSIPAGTASSAVGGLDNEGVAYNPASGKLYVSSEADQSIREYNPDGTPTGISFDIPADMAVSQIQGNKGFEALTFNVRTGLFWTTTEAEIAKDCDGILRLQSFGTDFMSAGRYLYQTDLPVKSSQEAAEAASYVFGVPALAALDDGRIIVLEREVFVSGGGVLEKALNSFTQTKLYVVNPVADPSGILRKTLLKSFTTQPLSATFANYEGMCLGPILPDGRQTLVLIPDSQNGFGGLTQEYVKVIAFK